MLGSMRRVSLKQIIGDNCATISLLLGVVKKFEANEQITVSKNQAIDTIENAISEMRDAINDLDISAGYLVIDLATNARSIASMLTQQMIDDAIKVDRTIDIIRMSDGKILDIDSSQLHYKWVTLNRFN